MVIIHGPGHFRPICELLCRAHSLEPETFDALWRPFLLPQDLPVFFARHQDDLDAMTAWLPSGVRIEIDASRAWSFSRSDASMAA